MKKIKITFVFTDPGKGCKWECDTRMEASDDGQKGRGKSTKRLGRGTESTGGGEALTGFAAVETAADAKQETRRQVCFRKIRAHGL